MRSSWSRPAKLRLRFTLQARRFRADVHGVTAIEFALVATPFFVFLMGIMTVGTQYLTAHLLQHGVEVAARKLMTGEAQKAGMTLADFRRMYCDEVGFMIRCDNNLVIHINSGARFADLPQVRCMTSDGDLTPASGNPGDSVRTRTGNASTAVKVNICYDWQMGLSLWQSVWGVLDPHHTPEGKTILTTATAFRSEPFE